VVGPRLADRARRALSAERRRHCAAGLLRTARRQHRSPACRAAARTRQRCVCRRAPCRCHVRPGRQPPPLVAPNRSLAAMQGPLLFAQKGRLRALKHGLRRSTGSFDGRASSTCSRDSRRVPACIRVCMHVGMWACCKIGCVAARECAAPRPWSTRGLSSASPSVGG
jgi:hypothetical protein